ncbi:MAG: DNA polymerase/3'-5' exonuclease PolX [Planctomyces sp.]|nr:DNA polymerase/3'-5' exonuclease PolX [Planctomyces sp.]
MQNAEIASQFEELADLLEIQGANPFRVRAYRNAARAILDSAESVGALASDLAKLCELPGIGEDLAKKIQTLVQTGAIPQLEELRQQIPKGVLEMMRIPGLGPKKAAALFHDLKIHTLEDLRKAAEANQIAGLKGFGKKTQDTILKGLELAESAGRRVYLIEAKAAADDIALDLQQTPGVQRVMAAGSCRRRLETCGDLDLLAIADDSTAVMDRLAAHRLVTGVLARGETKQRVRLAKGLELDLRVVPEESFGAALQYFTGSKEHNVELRRRAQERGLKLNEYGLFRGDERVAGRTEEEIYAALDLPWIPPELRENRREFALAERHALPELIDLADLRGDLHMHTTASDGAASIEEMAESAKTYGFEYIAITDHSQRVSMANGLDAHRLRTHWQEIERVRQRVSGIEILKGVECDILEDARLDLADDVLAEADWVVAVLHYGLSQPRDQIMKRLLTAIRSPHVDAIGHPTGRLIGRRKGADVDFELLLQAAADYGVMLEINAHPKRLDLDDIQAAAARDRGIPIVINTDSHSRDGFSMMEFGVYQARRAGLTAADVANTRPWPEFQKLLRR